MEEEIKRSGEAAKTSHIPRSETKPTPTLKATPPLLPCPFCGKPPQRLKTKPRQYYDDPCGKVRILCGTYQCPLNGIKFTVRQWNTRTSAWQAIETAPKDDYILLGNERGVAQCYWDREVEAEGGQCWRVSDPDMQRFAIIFEGEPTHWQPLPAKPVTGDDSETSTIR